MGEWMCVCVVKTLLIRHIQGEGGCLCLHDTHTHTHILVTAHLCDSTHQVHLIEVRGGGSFVSVCAEMLRARQAQAGP